MTNKNSKKTVRLRIVSIVLATISLFSLCSCKCKQVKQVEAQIRSIGSVTIDSGNTICKVEELYNALSDEEKNQVANYDVLNKARLDYNEILCDTIEHDQDIINVMSIAKAAMAMYSPRASFDQETMTYCFEVTADMDSTSAILYYPTLSSALFKVLENNMCDISSQIYEVTKKYDVDSVVIMHGYYSYLGNLFEIKNGIVTNSLL